MKIRSKELDGELLGNDAIRSKPREKARQEPVDGSTVAGANGETVQISRIARQLQAADLLKPETEDRSARIKELKRKIDSGSYNPSSEEVAQALIKELTTING